MRCGIPGTPSSSSWLAARNRSAEPKCRSRARRRAGPTPCSVSKIDSRAFASRSTAVSGVPELVQHEANGLLVPPHDAPALAAALAALLEDPARRACLGQAAQRTVADHFDLRAAAGQLAALFGRQPPAAPVVTADVVTDQEEKVLL